MFNLNMLLVFSLYEKKIMNLQSIIPGDVLLFITYNLLLIKYMILLWIKSHYCAECYDL